MPGQTLGKAARKVPDGKAGGMNDQLVRLSGAAGQLEQAARGSRKLGGSTQSHSEMGDAQLMAGSQQTLLLCPYIALRLASDIFLYRVSPAPGVAGHRIHGIV